MRIISNVQRTGLPFLSCLDVVTYCYDSPQDFDNPMGRMTNCLCLLVRGSVTICCAQGTICASSGDLVYWPEGVPYHSYWKSEGVIEMTGVYFRIRGMRTRQNGRLKNVQMPLCDQFVVLPGRDWLHTIREIERCYQRSGCMELALSKFYALYHRVKPCLPPGKRLRPTVLLARAYMEEHWECSISELAAFCRLSDSRLYHVFKEDTGVSLVEYRNLARIRRAADLLLQESASVEWISEKMNYSSPSYFRRVFRKYMGMTPSAYRASGGLSL